MRIAIPSDVRRLLCRLEESGYGAYAVGGCVRDCLLGKEPQDWDICTSATPEEILSCFSDCRSLLTGVQYGTVTVLWEEKPYEITTFRGESGYSDSRHPDEIRFLTSLREDLSRRDFTVNAMAADKDGQVTDCFGGMEDLKCGLLRCVGQPERRFAEDALRILRALRFAAKLDFTVEEHTARAAEEGKENLLLVSPERLRKELDGLLCGEAAARVLERHGEILFALIPELAPCKGFLQHNFHHSHDVWQHTLSALTQSEPVLPLRLAVLLHDIGKPAVFAFDKQLVGHFYGHSIVSAAMTEKLLRRLRYDNETLRRVTALVREHGFPLQDNEEKRIRRLLGKLGEEDARLLLRLRRADRLGKGTECPETVEEDISRSEKLLEDVIQRELCFSLKQLAIKGDDLLALGVPQGRKVGLLLDRLLSGVLEEAVPNERAALVEYAQNLMRNMESG